MKEPFKIDSPQDLKALTLEEQYRLAEQLRGTIIKTVSLNGGHLASSLGVIELTIALHSVFDSPVDKIIWDVGHQSYAHKLLTGRADEFHTLRQFGGISGFTKRSESPHDAFGTGHSSTSISAALGILEGRDRIGKDFKVIAVIGDGAMTAGLAFEGLNHAGHLQKDLIVVLNDNEMSISKNVGAMASYLSRILTGDLYKRIRQDTKNILESIPRVGGTVSKIAHKVEERVKTMFLPGMLFEELGFYYVGPLDGHNIEELTETLKRIKTITRPTLLHVITKKGKGFKFSEENPSVYHGIGPFEPDIGVSKKKNQSSSFSEVFGDALTELAEADSRVVAITAAMKDGTGLAKFVDRFPDRFYDVGIAEPHAVTFAAGLATQGIKPVVAIYSTFLQRSYDEIIHDVCLQNLPVIFAVDRSGIVGDDGPTHHGVFDISYLRHVPGICIMAPKNSIELKQMLSLGVTLDRPSVIKYPRGNVIDELEQIASDDVIMGRAEIIMRGNDIGIIAIGQTTYPAYLAAKKLEDKGIHASLVNARFVKPLDLDSIAAVGRKTKKLIVVEENVIAGGFGSSILEAMNSAGITDIQIRIMGLPDSFIEHGSQQELRSLYNIDENSIFATALSMIRQRTVV